MALPHPPNNTVLNLLLAQLPDEEEITAVLIDLLLRTHPALQADAPPRPARCEVIGRIGRA